MAKYRTIQQAYECLKSQDADTAITYHALRKLVVSRQFPCMRVGKKYLIDMELLSDFLRMPVSQTHLDFTPNLSDE